MHLTEFDPLQRTEVVGQKPIVSQEFKKRIKSEVIDGPVYDLRKLYTLRSSSSSDSSSVQAEIDSWQELRLRGAFLLHVFKAAEMPDRKARLTAFREGLSGLFGNQDHEKNTLAMDMRNQYPHLTPDSFLEELAGTIMDTKEYSSKDVFWSARIRILELNQDFKKVSQGMIEARDTQGRKLSPFTPVATILGENSNISIFPTRPHTQIK